MLLDRSQPHPLARSKHRRQDGPCDEEARELDEEARELDEQARELDEEAGEFDWQGVFVKLLYLFVFLAIVIGSIFVFFAFTPQAARVSMVTAGKGLNMSHPPPALEVNLTRDSMENLQSDVNRIELGEVTRGSMVLMSSCDLTHRDPNSNRP